VGQTLQHPVSWSELTDPVALPPKGRSHATCATMLHTAASPCRGCRTCGSVSVVASSASNDTVIRQHPVTHPLTPHPTSMCKVVSRIAYVATLMGCAARDFALGR